MRTETHLAYILIFLAILIPIWPILRIICFDLWHRGPRSEKKAKPQKPLEPKTPNDCAMCREEKGFPRKRFNLASCPVLGVKYAIGRVARKASPPRATPAIIENASTSMLWRKVCMRWWVMAIMERTNGSRI